MQVSPGTRLGPYEVGALVGQGGMGEVYRGVDTRLGRPVAIKVSTHEFSDRFEREARAISSLNHPHICTLYDVGPNYLVMEFVEGETLSRLITRGPLPLDKALRFGIEIVDALATAHAKGIVHRDLKPGNIIITSNGVKILDFGLAKLIPQREASDAAATASVGKLEPITGVGTLIGTLHYMAPEQVDGKQADERADIFAFGTVLYEMITGRRAFTGESQASVLASILKDEPAPMAERQPRTPRALERIVRRCLEKKPDDRWQSSRDLKPALELVDLDAASTSVSGSAMTAAVATSTRRKWLWPAVAVAAIVSAAASTYALWPKSPERVTRFEVPLPPGVVIEPGNFYVRVSPDGSKVAFTSAGEKPGIWVRDLESVDAHLLPDTAGAIAPFWSPDSRSIAFGLGNKLMRIDLTGGSPRQLAESRYPVGTGFWTTDGQIVFGHRGQGNVLRVSAGGGVPVAVTPGSDSFNGLPSPLPDGRRFLYLHPTSTNALGVFTGSLDVKPEEQPLNQIAPAQFGVTFVPGTNAAGGYLFFVQGDTLMAQPFDPKALQLRGEPLPVVQQIGKGLTHAHFSVTAGGVMAYRTGPGARTQPTWVDRQGNTLKRLGELGQVAALSLSPDEKQIAIVRSDATVVEDPRLRTGDIWLLDVERNIPETALTTGQSVTVIPDYGPIWSPDGKQIAYASGTRVVVRDAAGTSDARVVKDTGHRVGVTDWTRDGRFLLVTEEGSGGGDIYAIAVQDGTSIPLIVTDAVDAAARVSSDGAWVAYMSSRSGTNNVYVRPFASSGLQAAAAGPIIQISRDAGTLPKWSSDGKELFFLGGGTAGTVMVAHIETSGGIFRPAAPAPLGFAVLNGVWALGKDNQRILIAAQPDRGVPTPITVVTNWEAALTRH